VLTAQTADLEVRLQRLREACATRGIEAFVVSVPHNIAYLSNFDGSTALLVVTAARLYLLSDFRYSAAVARLFGSAAVPPAAEFVLVDGSYDAALARLVRTIGAEVVGFEATHVPVARARSWAEKCDAPLDGDGARRLVSVEGIIDGLRAIKDAHEIGILRESAARLSDVARAVLQEGVVAQGRTERAIAADIDFRMKMAGFERPAFDTIVATGANSALPHAHPTDAVVAEGDLVVLDFGGVFGGYCSDLTRTVVAGRPSAEQRRVYRAVYDAQQRAIAAVAAGIAADQVDAAARDHLVAAGLGDVFGHGTGHGLGLDVHEEPRVGKRRDDAPPSRLEVGMVITIEPGAYLDGFGGVRIEDDVVVLADGSDVLTDVPLDARLLDG
jgi:Xaa-Pro aminopeptidase